MKRSLVAFLLFIIAFSSLSTEIIPQEDSTALPISPPQKVLSRFQTDFDFHHDRGFYLNAILGPQWVHSIVKPSAKAVRFGGKVSAGWIVADGFAISLATWGHFLEQSSLLAIGPSMAFLIDSANMSIDVSLGFGNAFNSVSSDGLRDFSENVLATHLAIGKYWWLSKGSSLGISLFSGFHGLTVSQGSISTLGWNFGLGLSLLLG